MEFICEDCGERFDKPHTYVERHGFTYGPFEKWSVCPYCGSPGYKEYVEDEIECDGRCLNCDYYDTDDCPDKH